MEGKTTVREWINKFNNKEFEAKDFDTQVKAGWYDWFCSNEALSGRLKTMGNIIKLIKNDYLLDNYYVWFKNNCPASNHPLYDDFRFEPIDESKREQKYFGVQCDDKRNEHRYEVFTARKGYSTEFEADTKAELIEILNKLGTELASLH